MKATQESTSLAQFFCISLNLKNIPRSGWKSKLDLKNPESVADHTYSVAMLAMILSDQKNLDTQKILKMALLHDLAESIIGDIMPEEMTKIKKRNLENITMKNIFDRLNIKTSKQYLQIWNEYQKNTSDEAKLLHQIDKLEMAFQAKAYQKDGFTKSQIQPFFKSAKKEIIDNTLKEILKSIS